MADGFSELANLKKRLESLGVKIKSGLSEDTDALDVSSLLFSARAGYPCSQQAAASLLANVYIQLLNLQPVLVGPGQNR